jgi:glycosyltransferase involved in cell wall biosynthesis
MTEWWIQQDIVIQGILISFTTATLFQILYFWFIFGRVAFFNTKKRHVSDESVLPSVSVIIIAENDYLALRKNLSAVLQQDYPDFEVIVVNSSPQEMSSFYLLKSLQEQYPQLKIVDLPDVRTFYSRKKFLIALGVKESNKDILLLTNTDCQPDSPHWIRSMVSQMNNKKQLVLGYAGLSASSGRFYRLDMLQSSLTCLSLARCGIPYTGTGNNLAYSWELFNQANGLVSHYAIPYGDDTLFVNKNATKKNTVVVLHPDALVHIQSKMTFRRFMYLKKVARLSQKHYKKKHRFLLSLFPFTRFICYASFIALLCLLSLNMFYYTIIGIFGLRLISQLFITKKAMKRFNEKGLLFLSPLLEPVYMKLSWLVFLKTLFRRKKK